MHRRRPSGAQHPRHYGIAIARTHAGREGVLLGSASSGACGCSVSARMERVCAMGWALAWCLGSTAGWSVSAAAARRVPTQHSTPCCNPARRVAAQHAVLQRSIRHDATQHTTRCNAARNVPTQRAMLQRSTPCCNAARRVATQHAVLQRSTPCSNPGGLDGLGPPKGCPRAAVERRHAADWLPAESRVPLLAQAGARRTVASVQRHALARGLPLVVADHRTL
jgi:hypothetical protein